MAQSDSSPEQTWTIGRTLAWMNERFAECSQSARLDAQLLLGHVLVCDRVTLYTHIDKPLSPQERDVLRALVRRRLAGEPVAYILGSKHWHDMDLFVDHRVLIPRPETETLFDHLAAAADGALLTDAASGRHSVVVDLCTGSGCLALAFARRYPHARVVGIDVSHEALEVAELNTTRLGTTNVTWQLADVAQSATLLFEILQRAAVECDGAFVLVANPPYVTTSEWSELDPSVKNFEPRLALEAGEDGLDVARVIVEAWGQLFAAAGGATSGASTGASGVRPQCFFLGLELADGHPDRFVGANGLTALKDLDGRSRYLFGHAGETATLSPSIESRNDIVEYEVAEAISSAAT